MKKLVSLILAVSLILSSAFALNFDYVNAESDFKDLVSISMRPSALTVFKGEVHSGDISYQMSLVWIGTDFDSEAYSKFTTKVKNELVWKTSDSSIVTFIKEYDRNGKPVYASRLNGKEGFPYIRFEARKEGTAVISAYSKILKKTVKCTVTVKYAQLSCEKSRFFTGNTYQFEMKGNAKAVRYTSEDASIVSIEEKSGVAKAKKAGKVKLSCQGDNGKTYSKTITVNKPKLSYTKITSYYFNNFKKGSYRYFPIIADGIDVKSWKSSNTKVVKVIKNGNVGNLEIHGTGKATVTCTDVNGKKYTCKVTIVGGKPWSDLQGGYCPTKSVVKNHGYYKDINKIQDYGNVVFFIVDYEKKINYGNGYSKKDAIDAQDRARKILEDRYPKQYVQTAAQDNMLVFTDGKKKGRLFIGCYYVSNP